jgi:elongation factor G
MEPHEQGKGFEFVDAIRQDGAAQFIPAVENLKDAAQRRARGLPVVDVKVTLFDGGSRRQRANENAFKMAASIAFRTACGRRPRPARADDGRRVEHPSFMGNVVGDLFAAPA